MNQDESNPQETPHEGQTSEGGTAQIEFPLERATGNPLPTGQGEGGQGPADPTEELTPLEEGQAVSVTRRETGFEGFGRDPAFDDGVAVRLNTSAGSQLLTLERAELEALLEGIRSRTPVLRLEAKGERLGHYLSLGHVVGVELAPEGEP